MKKANHGLAKSDYTHWLALCTIDKPTDALDNAIKMAIERKLQVSMSKCKEVEPLNGRRRLVMDFATEENYKKYLDFFAKQRSFDIGRNQWVYLSVEGIAHDRELVKGFVSKLRGRLVTGKSYTQSNDLFLSDGFQPVYVTQENEFEKLYESMKLQAHDEEKDLTREVDQILHSMYPNFTNNSILSKETRITNIETGISKTFLEH